MEILRERRNIICKSLQIILKGEHGSMKLCTARTLGFMGKKLFFIFCADGAIHKLVKEVLIGFTGHGMRLLS
jgi:hypothetical protein